MLTGDLLARVESMLGAQVVAQRAASGGYTPALRLVCQTRNGSVFVKVGVTPLTAQFVRREISVYERMQAAFMPRLRAASVVDDVPSRGKAGRNPRRSCRMLAKLRRWCAGSLLREQGCPTLPMRRLFGACNANSCRPHYRGRVEACVFRRRVSVLNHQPRGERT